MISQSQGVSNMKINDEVKNLIDNTEKSIGILSALGDETRLYILLELLKMYEPRTGARAVEIADKINLSRPAVSHHLQILKDAGILSARSEGAKIYYSFDKEAKAVKQIISLCNRWISVNNKL